MASLRTFFILPRLFDTMTKEMHDGNQEETSHDRILGA
jgi:hypothetical protein